MDPFNCSFDHCRVALLRKTPASENEITRLCQIRKPVNLVKNWPQFPLKFVPKPAPIILNNRRTIPVSADDERISQHARPPYVDALATPGLSIDNGNHNKNSFLVFAQLPTANT